MAPGYLVMLSRKKEFAWKRCLGLVGRSDGFMFFPRHLSGKYFDSTLGLTNLLPVIYVNRDPKVLIALATSLHQYLYT